MHVFNRIVEWLEYTVLVISFSVMSIITFSNVISRYFLNKSLAFTEEVTINLFVLMTFVGAAVGIRRKAHLGFSLLFDKLSFRLKVVVVLFIGAVAAMIFVILIYYGFEMAMFQKMLNQTTPALRWPQWLFSLGLPVGSMFCLYRLIESTWLEVKQIMKDERGSQAC